jgi:hypothetical protein
MLYTKPGAREGERKSPSMDSLENMVNLYGTTTDFLPGHRESHIQDSSQPVYITISPNNS